MLGGDTLFYVFISIIVSCFTYATLIINLYYEVIHDIYLLFFCFVKSRIYFILLVFSAHAFMCLLSVSGIYKFIIVYCFTYATLIINLYYEVIHDICLLFFCSVKSRIYFILLVFSTHAFMCLLSVSGIYKFIQSCCCLHWQLIDRS